MNNKVEGKAFRSGNAVLGGVLILLGAAFLIGELLDIRIGSFIWPFFVIGPGVFLFLLALILDDQAGQGLAAVGGLVSMTGLILLYQSVSGHWNSWTYAWALVAPTSIGLGMYIFAWLKDKPALRQESWRIIKVGLGIFVVTAVFFELIIGISGFGLGRFGWPVLLIGLGLLMFFRNLNAGWHKEVPETAGEEKYHVYDHS